MILYSVVYNKDTETPLKVTSSSSEEKATESYAIDTQDGDERQLSQPGDPGHENCPEGGPCNTIQRTGVGIFRLAATWIPGWCAIHANDAEKCHPDYTNER